MLHITFITYTGRRRRRIKKSTETILSKTIRIYVHKKALSPLKKSLNLYDRTSLSIKKPKSGTLWCNKNYLILKWKTTHHMDMSRAYVYLYGKYICVY